VSGRKLDRASDNGNSWAALLGGALLLAFGIPLALGKAATVGRSTDIRDRHTALWLPRTRGTKLATAPVTRHLSSAPSTTVSCVPC
jgi:hypothetical protein